MLSDEQKFLFDLEGYVILKRVLSPAQCTALINLADQSWPRSPQDGPYRRCEEISRWHQQFLDLADHPAVLPVLIQLLGSRLRLDHDYCIFMRSGAPDQPIHGGPRRYETDHWYHYADGVMRNGLTVATWSLTDAKAGDGGFVCVPGSHKTNFITHLPADVRSQERQPHYVHQPTLNAGDVLIFTEALMHGTKAWVGDHERRALLYKYSPPHSTWRIAPYDLSHYPTASAQQRRLMAPPSVERHEKVVQPD